MRTSARMPTQLTTGVLSPRKAIGKRLVPSSSGGGVAHVAALQMVEPNSLEYTPACRSPARHHVRGQVGISKVLSPPLDYGERESINSNSRTVQHFRSPPPIRGPREVHAYSSEEEEEDPKEWDEVKELREQLNALKVKLSNMDERVAESKIERMNRSSTLRKQPGMRTYTGPRT